jgi:hypothetical protein
MALVVISASPPASADVDVSFGFFYSDLSPHGSWLVSANYGQVWQPRVYSADWNPYYDGRWVYSDFGWTWVSDYAWGDVPYHYGTWTLDPVLGWVWVPGYVWAPSWVVFRTGPDYIGWAPVSPSFSVGLSGGSYDYDPNLFVFVGARNFLAPQIRTYVVPTTTTRTFIRSTTVVNNINIENNVVVNRGPDLRVVEQATGKQIEAQPIERVEKAAPGGRANRTLIRVESAKAQTGLRVAEPVPAEQPLPDKSLRADQGSRGPTSRPDTRPMQPQPGTKSSTGQEPKAKARTEVPAPAGTPDTTDAKVKAARAQVDAQAKAEAQARADAQAKADKKAQADAKAQAKADKKARKDEGTNEAQAKPDKKKKDNQPG